MEKYHITIIMPIFNEAENINRVYNEIVGVVEGVLHFDILYVDDGSTDGSFALIEKIAENDPRVTIIKLNRNYGQQNAMYVGIIHAQGDVLIMLDGDGQFDASCIHVLVKEMFTKDLELVSGVRASRADTWINRVSSKIGNFFINKALEINQRDFGAVKAIRFNLKEKILSYPVSHSVHPYTLAYRLASSYGEASVKHNPRVFGESKWTFFKRLRTYFDIYVSFSLFPFAWLMWLAFLSGFTGILTGFGVMIYRIMNPGVHFSGLIIFFALFLISTGIIFLTLSILGDFVIRGYRNNFIILPDATIQKNVMH